MQKFKKSFKKFTKNFLVFSLIFFTILSASYSEPTAEVARATPQTIILNFNQTILTEGTTWTVPSDWTDGNNTIEVIGGGGAGYSDASAAAGAAGGGGGGYSKSVNVDLTPGATVTYAVGVGGKVGAVDGGDTYFCNSTSNCASILGSAVVVGAKAGTGATSASANGVGGASGSGVATGTGNVKYSGGDGGDGHTTGDDGGGGGGAGGPNGNGGAGGNGNTLSATYGHGGGGGGNGGGANGGTVSGNPPSPNTSGAGGNNSGGSGGAAGVSAGDGTNGSNGGGGSGGFDANDAGNGGNGIDLASGAVGGGGGGGGAGDMGSVYGGDGGLYGAGGGGGRYGGRGAQGIIVITYNGNTPTKTSWTVPSDWDDSNNTIEVIGAGGAGYSVADSNGAAGGGGGAYSKITNLDLTPGASVVYQIGAGGRKTATGAGAGLSGTDTFFNRTAGSAGTCADTTSVCAKAGTGATSVTVNGVGGASGSGTGTTKTSGGDGGDGNNTGDSSGGGGGAGQAGEAGQLGGTGQATTDWGGGGGGGAGDDSGTDSTAGANPSSATGGAGGNGRLNTGDAAGTGGGGDGGNDGASGTDGYTGNEWTSAGAGGGGGGTGDNTSASNRGGDGGFIGGGGGGGSLGGFGANGAIVITYEPIVFTISGTADIALNGSTVKVAYDNSVQAQTATINSGSWTITGAPTPSATDIITVWVDNVADGSESTAITEYSSGVVSGMVLQVNKLFIGSNQNTTVSVTEADSYSCADDEDAMHSVVGGALNVEGQSCAGSVNNSYTDEWLNIEDTFTVASASSESITSETIYFSGTLTATGTPSIYATDLFYNSGSGTFNAGSSTVEISTSSNITFNSAFGNETFYNLVFSGSGTKTSADAFAVNNNLTISAGTLDDGGYQITGNGSGVLSAASGASLKLGSAGTATTFPTSFTNGNISLNASSSVVYQAGVAQTISGTPTYGQLTITPLSGTPTMTLGAATVSSASITVTAGTLDTANYAITARAFTVSGSAALTLGSSLVSVVAGGAAWNYTSSAASSMASSTIKFVEATGTSNAKTFSGNGKTYGTLWFAAATSGTSTGAITITGSNTFSEFKDDNNGAGAAHSILFTAGTTQTVTTWTVSGTSGNVITINSGDGAGGTSTAIHTLSKASGNASSDYLNIQHSVAGGGAGWYAGVNSTDNQGTADAGSGWIFTAPPIPINITVNASATTCTGAPSYTGTSDCNVLNTDINGYLNSNTTVTLTAYGGNVTFSNSISKTTSGTATMNVYAGINIIHSAAIGATTGSLNVLFNADRQQTGSGYINVAGSITTNGGNITMGGGSGTISAGSGFAVGNSGQATGIYVNNVAISAGGGNIIMNGQGYNTTTNGNHGIRITGASGIVSTTGSGTIDVKGLGKGNTNSGSSDTNPGNVGLYMDAGGILSTVNGNLTVYDSIGGGAGTGTRNYGIYIAGTNTAIKSTGDGNVTVTGTGGNSTGSGARNYGVYCLSASCVQKTTSTGTLTVNGTGGGSSGNINIGIFLDDFNENGSITGAGGAMVINGTGGPSTAGDNYGVNVSNPSAVISNTGSGSITITATGGGITNSATNLGLYIDTQADITAVDGTITITATGGGAGSGTNNNGLRLASAGSSIKTTGSGNIVINGVRGGGDTSSNYGVNIISVTNAIQTTGTGNITLNTDTILLDGSDEINSAGTLTMATYTNGESIGVAGGTGTLGLTSTFLGYLTYATSLTIGKAAQTGTTTLGAYASWVKPINFVVNASGSIAVSGAQTNTSTFSFTGPTTLSAALNATALTIVSGTFNAGSQTITLSGTGTVFSNSGTFTAGTSTISITDSSASTKTFAGGGGTYATFTYAPGAGTGKLVLSGNNTFTSFSDTGTGAHTLEFTAGSTTTVTSFNIESATASVITLSSSTPTSYWYLVDTAGTNQVRYVSITDSCASGGATWDAYTYSADNTNGGHNCGWVFTSGISVAGTANGNNAATVKIAYNNSVQGQTSTIGGGTWSITGLTTPTSNDIITVWVDGVADALETTAITKWSSGNITGMVLNTGVLTVGSNQDTSLSFTNIDSYSCADNEDVMHSVISNVLNVEGQTCAGSVNNSYTDETLSVLDTFTIATTESMTTEKIENNGTITASGSPTITLTGTSGVLFSNYSTFTPATSEVVVASATGSPQLLVNGGGTTFHRLKINIDPAETLTAGASITMSSADAANRLYIQSGGLADGGEQIIGTANGTFVMDANTMLSITEAFVSSAFPTNYTNGNITLNSSSVVFYASSSSQTISGAPTYGNLIIGIGGTSTLGASTTVAGNLTISASETLQLSTYGLSVTGTTSISGTLNDNSATGTNLFTGAVTINSGGIWTTSNNPAFEFRGGLTNDSSSGFTSGSGTYTFSTNAQTLGGAQAFTITDVYDTITSGNGLTISSSSPTITTLSQEVNSVLTFSGTVPTITNKYFSNTNSTTQYTGSGQTILAASYNHLIINSGGTETLGGTVGVDGNLTVSAGTLQLSTQNFSVTGTSSITGTLNDNSTTGTNYFYGNVTINSGGIWTTTNDPAFNFDGNFTNNSSSGFTSGAGDYRFLGSAEQTLSGTQSFTITSVRNSNTNGTNGLILSGAQPTITQLTQDTSKILTFSGVVPTISSFTPNASPNTVQYTRNGDQTIINTTYHHLITSTGGTKTLAGNTTVNGNFTVGSGATFNPTTSYTITGSGTNVLTMNGIAYVQHSTLAGSYPSFETITPGASSTFDYILNGTQTVDNAVSYANLNISTGGTKTLGGATAVSANLTVGSGATLDSSTYLLTATGTNILDITGTLVVGGTNFTDSYTGFDTRNLNAGSIVNYGKSDVQNIDNTLSYVHLTTSGSGVKTLAGNTTITGNATIGASTTLDPTSSYTFTGSGTNILTNNGTIRVQHSTFAGSYPSWETKTLTGGTVDYYLGGTQTVDSSLSYGGLTISTSGTKSLDGALSATGAIILSGGTFSSGNHYTINGNSISMTGGTFTPGDAQINLSGTGTVFSYSSGTYTRSGETINITDSTASDKTFTGGGQSFWNVNFTGTGTGALTISGSNTFNKLKITNPPHTIKFTAGTTQNVKYPEMSGISGSLNVLNSTTNGQTWTMYFTPTSVGEGNFEQEFISLRDSTATGNASFVSAYASNSTNTANNNGWTFSARSRGGGTGAAGGEGSEDPQAPQGGGGQGGGGCSENCGGGGQGGGGQGGGGGGDTGFLNNWFNPFGNLASAIDTGFSFSKNSFAKYSPMILFAGILLF